MSKLALVVTGLVLAAIGFGVGRYTGSSPEPTKEAPPRPVESRGVTDDVLREPDPFARAAGLATLLATLGPEAVPEVRARLKERDLELADAADAFLLARFWATHDPAGASKWALKKSPPAYRAAAIALTIELWARVDPEAALQAMRSMAQGTIVQLGESEAAQIALVRGWFDGGKPGLEAYIQSLGISHERQRALRVFFTRMVERDGSEAVRRWVEALPDPDVRYKLAAFRQAGGVLGDVDPAAAVAFCEANCLGPFGANVRARAAAGWAAHDGAATMEWLSTSPAGNGRDEAVRSAFLAWRRNDPESLSSWMAGMKLDEVEPWFRPAAPLYAMWLSWKDPEEALRWVALADEDEKRELAFVTIARRWRETDEKAAEAWLETSPLSEEARAKARNYPPRYKKRARQAPPPPDEES